MMDEVKYIPVKEFAERAGVSTQAIYKAVRKANGKLSPYVIQDGNRYYIKSNALTEVYGVGIIETNLTTNQPTAKVENQPKNQPERLENNQLSTNQPTQEVEKQPTLQPTNQPETNPFTTYLLSQIDELKAEIERYKSIVQEKDRMIAEQNTQMAELTQSMVELSNRALTATTNQQQLSAMDKQPIFDNVEQPRKGFINRLFSKKERN